jgi:predicted nucleic acid-binding protein
VRVYAESNFVLEVALAQEQHESCAAMLVLAERQAIRLVLPAFSLTEPHETLERRRRQRTDLSEELDRQLGQLGRSAYHRRAAAGLRDLSALLVDSHQEDLARFSQATERLLVAAELAPLDRAVLALARDHQKHHRLEARDAVVLASVVSHLRQHEPEECCFVSRDQDFAKPGIAAELARYSCKPLVSFDNALGFINSRVG